MSSQAPKSSKPSSRNSQSLTSATTTPPSKSPSSSLSSHLAMIELKQRVLTSLSKLSDRDTHQIACEDLERIIQTLTYDAVPMLLNCLYDATTDPNKPAVKKESLRLLAALCAAHHESTATHLTKIISHIVKRLKDSDSGVRDACRDAIGALSALYLMGGGGGGGEGDNNNNAGLGSVVVSLFVKPLFEAMSEQNKGVQVGAAMCMGKMVDCASEPPVGSLSKLCPRICKYLSNPNFLAKAALLPVVSSLSQVGAIAPQNLESLLHSIHECLGSTDWATRKAAADTLSALALHSSNLIEDGASASMVTVLEACRFDKIKPVRDSMMEALQLWKKIAKGGDRAFKDQKASSHDGGNPESAESLENNVPKVPSHGDSKTETLAKDSSNGSSPTDKGKGGNILDKAVGILKKKAPALTDKELNPEFFQRLETRVTDDLPVEVVVPRWCPNSASTPNEDQSEPNDKDSRGRPVGNSQPNEASLNIKYRGTEKGNSGVLNRQRDLDEFARDKWAEERGIGKDSRTNWLAIQRQLSQLERQQTHLMNMLQDFMGGSHDSMVTLENRVRGLERIVEDMVHDLSISTRRGSNFMAAFEGSNRSSGKYNGFHDYGAKLGRSNDGWLSFGERYGPSDSLGSSMRGRGPSWRSDVSVARDFHYYGKNGQMGSRRVLGGGAMDGRSPRSEHESDQVGNRRAWDKGEGPSARSVWQASKDEATLEAIRVAGEDNGTVSRTSRVAIPELTAEAMGDDNAVPERDPVWTSWSNAMDALHVGDMDSAYAEVLSTGDDLLLVKLMDKSGAVVDQLSNEVACEVLHAVAEFLREPNLFDVCLYWIQQLVDVVGENGPDVLGIPGEVKKVLLLNLHEACSAVDPPEDWEGATPDQLLLQLASVWGINLQQLEKQP